MDRRSFYLGFQWSLGQAKPSVSLEIGMSKEKSQRRGPWEGVKGRVIVMKIKSRNEDQLPEKDQFLGVIRHLSRIQ